MDDFERACTLMHQQLGQDTVIALATCENSSPGVRNVDCYYRDGRLLIVTHTASFKMQQVSKNNAVAFCRGCGSPAPFHEALLEGFGVAENLGHPKEAKNQALREEIRRVFSEFYEKHVDENDPGTCIVSIRITKAVVFDGEYKYTLDYEKREAQKSALPIS